MMYVVNGRIMDVKEKDQIHAITFKPLKTTTPYATLPDGALITIHPDRKSALDFFKAERENLAKSFVLPVDMVTGGFPVPKGFMPDVAQESLWMTPLNVDSLMGTIYAMYPEKLNTIQRRARHFHPYAFTFPHELHDAEMIGRLIIKSKKFLSPLEDMPKPTEPGTRPTPTNHRTSHL